MVISLHKFKNQVSLIKKNYAALPQSFTDAGLRP